MEFSFNTLTAFRLVRRRRSWAPWAHVEGSAKRGNGPSSVEFNSQAGIDRGSCRALMPMTGTAMKCRANRKWKEWVRQVQFEFVHNFRVRLKELTPFSHELQTKDKIGGGTAADRGSRGMQRDQPRNPPDIHGRESESNFPFPCPSRGRLPPVGLSFTLTSHY